MQEQEVLEERLNEEILNAVSEAEKLGPPPLASMIEDVFAEIPQHLREQFEALTQGRNHG